MNEVDKTKEGKWYLITSEKLKPWDGRIKIDPKAWKGVVMSKGTS